MYVGDTKPVKSVGRGDVIKYVIKINATLDIGRGCSSIFPWVGIAVWPLMLTLPVLLTSRRTSLFYENNFPSSWYEYEHSSGDRPKVLGLILGITAVAVGQIFVLTYFYIHRNGLLLLGRKQPPSIQVKGAPEYDFFDGVRVHLSQPEGFVLLGLYLSGTWMFRLIPSSYYSFHGGIQWCNVALCLVLQDFIQYLMHCVEHVASPTFYRYSHKPHHRFTNPKLFDAFNGSPTDTICMILIPLYITAWCINCNVWTYMAFGSVYANWLTLIHSEFPYPWDKLFRLFGLGTPGDHHIHHKLFKYNYGHLFLWFDQISGTYRSPEDYAPRFFSEYA